MCEKTKMQTCADMIKMVSNKNPIFSQQDKNIFFIKDK